MASTMIKKGLTKIDDTLELINFSWKIGGVYYDWETDKAYVTVIMIEPNKTIPFGRDYKFDTDGKIWTNEDAKNAILNHELFKGSIKED